MSTFSSTDKYIRLSEPHHEKTCLQGLRPGSVPSLFAYGKNRFSHDGAHLMII